MMSVRKRIFVGGAFTEALDSHNSFHDDTRLRIQVLIQIVSARADDIFSSHLAENWGKDLEIPSSLVKRDLAELDCCSHLVTYLGPVHSFGSLVEIGYAVRLGKPILIVYESGRRPKSDFFEGLVDSGQIREVEWTERQDVETRVGAFVESSKW